MNYQQPALRRALAADYAIGLMSTAARLRFEKLLLEDPALRAELGNWQTTLASLTDPLPEQPAPAHVWQAIVARIDPQTLHVPEKRPFWSWLRIAAIACSLMVAIIVGVLYNRDTLTYNATLTAANQQPAISVHAYNRHLEIEPLALASVEPGRSLELWAIPADGKPVSLGVLPANVKGRLNLSESQQQLLSKPVTLAVSLEPTGGSPTGQPTGPVLYKGALAGL
ncbi:MULTISPECIES: anti-sigma factor [unclassified Pseudomonas]|uniref:anti-sigma factor n=1 Tax=unclassified Pseudomonas TaxID=196821 RepID=UPI002AC938B4|nr:MULTISPECIES: anti-sigma factor [unclassified Pseudomonas]MEB0042514.1 anti-sigma factor [Pseudomonas sp. MH10]MEB0077325.1 anti-sigma factor [Pseudomonas sp. MH10out]MEB0103709.1 anti-sigma factor [Pseudomonas sp. CCI3.2]MEB0129928.1 anti-sigma factor [Pseudomonas sp. CCI2.4]MEB0159972.1 anti-sigma factor [Pseudomonas sp. AH2 (2023)]